MKRISVRLTPEVERALEAYLERQSVRPTLSAVVNVALRDFCQAKMLYSRGYRPATGELKLPVSDAEVEPDVSLNHDAYR